VALVESITIPCSIKGAVGLTVERHDDATVRFTDPETLTTKSCALTLANMNKLFIAIRETFPRLSGIAFT